MAVSTTYLTANGGTPTTPPTAAQAANINSQAFSVIASADGDTDVVITHNWGLTAAQIALLQPWPRLFGLQGAAASFALSNWTVKAWAANTITLTKTTAGGSGNAAAQLGGVLERPHSIVQ